MRLRLQLLLLAAGLAWSQQTTVTVLATTDMHGNLFPVDYVTGQPAARGLAKVATLIRAEEAGNPNHLLIDCGDTIQGTPLEYAYQDLVRTGSGPLGLKPATPLDRDPMMLAMNLLGYDAMAVGNHEYNFGLKNLNRARSDAHFPWLSANTSVAAGGKERPFDAYVIKNVGGVKVAVIGITTPAVPTWEKPENIGSYRFLPPVDALKKAVADLRASQHPDLIVVAAHTGLGRDLNTGRPDNPDENATYAMAVGVPDVDAIVFGHSHSQLAGAMVGNVLLVQPKNWAISLARLDFTMERKPGGGHARRARHPGHRQALRGACGALPRYARGHFTGPAERGAGARRRHSHRGRRARGATRLLPCRRFFHRSFQPGGSRAARPGDRAADRRALSLR
jgi:2',3'-cyclic-nucleotide 2'-phosphodiesterase/3'-nucleotidase